MKNQVSKKGFELKSLSWFFAASVTTSVLNYLFHVVVARRLGAEAFAQFSVVWSYLSLYFIGGGFVLYFATLNSLTRKQKRILMIGLQVVALLAFALDWVSIALVVENLMFNFLVGFCLRRKDYAKVNSINLCTAVLRISILIVLPASLLSTPWILRGVFLSFIIVQGFYLLMIRGSASDDHADTAAGKVEWLTPTTLALISGLIPQIDMVWTANFAGREALMRMSELALVSKGVFFLQMIFSQWMLPMEQKRVPSVVQIILVLAGIASVSAVTGTVAFYVLPVVLRWTTPLTIVDFIKICMVGMTSSLFYMLAQLSAKRALLIAPVIAVFVLVGQAFAQGFAGLSLDLYLWLTIVTYTVLILSLTVVLNQATRSSLREAPAA